ncbi:hypothetical protein ACFOG5_02220 [Pedobacter fastidiosus]|uniref:hypothetical protein n=1 Tax=Pedobacter fastidiosus TaxID=2765361 RepID=UPI003608CA04
MRKELQSSELSSSSMVEKFDRFILTGESRVEFSEMHRHGEDLVGITLSIERISGKHFLLDGIEATLYPHLEIPDIDLESLNIANLESEMKLIDWTIDYDRELYLSIDPVRDHSFINTLLGVMGSLEILRNSGAQAKETSDRLMYSIC